MVPARHSQGPPLPRSGIGLGLGLGLGLGIGVRVRVVVRVRRTVGVADRGSGGPWEWRTGIFYITQLLRE